MTSYVPKYQFEAVMARRTSKSSATEFKYQQLLKSGRWGAVRTGSTKYHTGKTPQEVVEYWNKVNEGKTFRLVEA
jgi:hypothetical protein